MQERLSQPGVIFWFQPKNFGLAMLAFPDIGQELGLSAAEPKDIVVNILRLVLQYLPLVAVVMIILGGLRWMTAGGDEEKVSKAKHTLSAAVVGMVIVLLAWAIVNFLVDSTLDVTNTSQP